ncbi:MAG: DUF2937 family protein [Beijerinckiaceae bacterium]
MFILRQFGLLFGVIAGLITSQAPEFAQQYRQRIGGAIDELQRIIDDFDRDVTNYRMTRTQGLERLAGDPDPFVKQRGRRIRETEARLSRLKRQSESFKSAGSVRRIAVLADNFDPGLARRTYRSFEPALPLTAEGLIAGLAGFLAGFGLWKLLSWPLNRFSRRDRKTQAQEA